MADTASLSQTTTAQAPHMPAVAKTIPFSEIPMVDFAGFRDGSAADKARVAAEIGKVLNEVGFFYLKNHGIPQAAMDKILEVSSGFFGGSEDVKQSVSSDHSDNHRGFFPIGAENVNPLQTRDLKEGFDACFEGYTAEEDLEKLGPRSRNQWPEGHPQFRPGLETYFEEASALSADVCRAFALALDLEETAFDKNMERAASRLRLLSYPGQPAESVKEKEHGIGAHSDCGCLTILLQDNTGGLAVLNSDGEWIAAEPVPGTLIVNVGDMMEQWSGGKFASTVHCVINTSPTRRHSVALFYNPGLDVIVDSFKSLVGAEPSGEERSTSEEYMSCCFSEIRGGACQLPD